MRPFLPLCRSDLAQLPKAEWGACFNATKFGRKGVQYILHFYVFPTLYVNNQNMLGFFRSQSTYSSSLVISRIHFELDYLSILETSYKLSVRVSKIRLHDFTSAL